nr:transposase [Pseudoflavonifractor phocaeensis]
MPTKGNSFLSTSFLEYLFRASNNQNYFCKDLPRQVAQHVIKEAVEDMSSFFATIRAYNQDPSKFKGRPRLPGYGAHGGCQAVTLTNQICILYATGTGETELKFPFTNMRLPLGKAPIAGKLKEVKVIPSHGIFIVLLSIDDGKKFPKSAETTTRACCIDLGVSNFAAITNNLGLPCLLFKGGVPKSINQWYNKRMSKIQSEQTTRTGKKFVPTPESRKLELWRENHLNDYMSKTAKLIIRWCAENHIDAIIIGVNQDWKQGVNMGAKNNQEFVSIPYAKFRWQLAYRAERAGIKIIEREESYTSRASFLDNDFIPTVGEPGADQVKFSGRRTKRGLYRSKDKTTINADFNGSANIGRKEIPDLFTRGVAPDFGHVLIYKHPDMPPVERKVKM